MPLNEFGEALIESVLDEQGCEALEESDQDKDFLHKQFGDTIAPILAGAALASLGGADEVELLVTCYFTGMTMYRNFLIERGVNVRELEGRE